MKKGGVTILLMACMVLMARHWIPILLFQANQNYIADELCVKKDLQGNTCQGICFLNRQLREQEQTEGQAPIQRIAASEPVFVPSEQLKAEPLPPCQHGLMIPLQQDPLQAQFHVTPMTPPPWAIPVRG